MGDRQAGDEIEVTPDMVDADILAASGCDDPIYLGDWLPEAFVAMLGAGDPQEPSRFRQIVIH